MVSQLHFGGERVNTEKMFYTCLLCMYTLGSWSSRENYTIVDEYDEKCRLYNPCELHRGYAIQIKDCNSFLEEICDSYEDSHALIVNMINVISGRIHTPL